MSRGYIASNNAVLTTDIVFNPGTVSASGVYTPAGGETPLKWTSGIGNEDNPYTGTFDGNGKTISGLYQDDGSKGFAGLFGVLDTGGVVKNVYLANARIVGQSINGGIAGVNEPSGGSQPVITVCCNAGAVTGYEAVGGIVGNNQAAVDNCHNVGSVSAIKASCGNLAGGLRSGSSLTNSFFNKTTAASTTPCAAGTQYDGSNRKTTFLDSVAFVSGRVAYELNGKKYGRSCLIPDHWRARRSCVCGQSGLLRQDADACVLQRTAFGASNVQSDGHRRLWQRRLCRGRDCDHHG